MASIWKQNKDVTQQVKRNNHDLSFDNHCTMKLGYLYPVFKKFVVPGDSFRIRSAFDLKLMPLVFPLQSRMRAHLHFFFVRCKNVWPEIEDYLTGIPRSTPIVEPYLMPEDSDVKTGSIYDFLGVPTTLVSKSAIGKVDVIHDDFAFYFLKNSLSVGDLFSESISVAPHVDSVRPVIVFDISSLAQLADFTCSQFLFEQLKILNTQSPFSNNWRISLFYGDTLEYSRFFAYDWPDNNFVITDTSASFKLGTYSDSLKTAIESALAQKGVAHIAIFPSNPTDPFDFSALSTEDKPSFFTFPIPGEFAEYSDLNLGLYRNHLHLKAMPFRAYESIYRAYYANDVLQPLVDGNGDAQYNKFCTTTASGYDGTKYHLFKRNYELDFLTSAYPSPQAGPAPLVGISALGNITIEDENGITTAKAVVDENTGQITGISITSPLASVEHGRTLVNISQAGISINDFRNANALQRFLEQTLRSGYRYIDFIRGQWGVKPKDQALDMPEFIGGFSRDVALQTVTSVADMATGAPDEALSKQLGGFAGVGRVLGGSEHAVSKFCDDYGYIIGVMSVTPTPAYSQLLDKQMIAGDNYLSFPFPEFNQLGMQPIPYKEVAPIQSFIDSLSDPSKTLNDTFGYQRPNYDLVGSVDEVHGEFRSSLKDFLINRIFDGRPELGSSFIEIDPSEVNDVFVNQSPDDDVLIGHIRFKVDTKRPFPRIHFPSL